jgi:predicted alpha/beta-fold hydrolase
MGAYENQAFYPSQDLAAIALIFDDRGSGTFSQDSFSISKVGTETRTITITGSGYSDPRWFVDGVEKAPGNSITLAATAYPLGGHSLSLWVVKNNRPWSKELAFTVVN